MGEQHLCLIFEGEVDVGHSAMFVLGRRLDLERVGLPGDLNRG